MKETIKKEYIEGVMSGYLEAMLDFPRVSFFESQSIDLQMNRLVVPLCEAHNLSQTFEKLFKGCLKFVKFFPIL